MVDATQPQEKVVQYCSSPKYGISIKPRRRAIETNSNNMKQSQPTILVTDTSRGSAISIIRSLGRRGWRVIAADANPKSLGFRSRFVHGTFVYPKPESAQKRLLRRSWPPSVNGRSI